MMSEATNLLSHNWGFAFFLLGVFGLIGFMLGVSSLLGSKAFGRSKNEPFESGMLPTGGARLRQIGNMAAVQNIEAAIGKHQRARQSGQALGQVFGRADFVFEIGQQPRLHDKSFQIKGMAA